MARLTLLLRLWTWFTFRHMRIHFRRTLAVLVGIGLGAAVFTSVRLAASASLHSFKQSMAGITGKADWSAVCPGKRVPEETVSRLLRNPAVLHAAPVMTAYVKPADEPGPFFLLVGVDPVLDHPFRPWQVAASRAGPQPAVWLDLMTLPFSFIAGPGLARHFGIDPGSTVSLEHVQDRARFHVLGTLESQGLAMVDGGDVAITDIATFQEFTGCFGAVDRIDLILKPGASPSDLAAIRAQLPDGVTLERPSEASESGEFMIRSYQLNLSVLSFVSLFVGMFLVYSLVALHAKSRRPEVAILRSLGASSRLVFLIFLAEGVFFGVTGWVVAIPLASLLVRKLLAMVSSTISLLFVRVRVEELIPNPWEIVISFAVTVGVCLLATAHPARQAMFVSPRDALVIHEGASGKGGTSLRRTSFLGVFLIAAVWPISKIPATYGIPFSGYVATFFLFLGFSLLSPWCLKTAGRVASPLLRRFIGEPAHLGGRYVHDAGTRVAISVGALITAVGLFVGLVIMIHSFRNTLELWVSESVSGDLFLRPKMADMNRYRTPLPEAVIDGLGTIKTPVALMPYRRIFLHYGKNLYQFESIDVNVFMDHARFLFIEGDEERVRAPLVQGEGVLVSEVFANQTNLGVGQRFQARVLGFPLDLPILGVVRDYRTQGGVVFHSLPRLREITGDGSWSGVRIFLMGNPQDREAASARLRGEVLEMAGNAATGIEITTGRELHRAIMKIFDETFAVTGVLLLIALMVATLGIATTLTVLVLERTRQLQTLRAVGAGLGQIRVMILWEAILMVLAGEVIGLACGFLLSRLLIFVVNRQSFGWTFIYSVDWGAILLSLPLILATALAAALPAGQAGFKRSPAEALKEM